MQRRRQLVWRLLQWLRLSWSVPKKAEVWSRIDCYCYNLFFLTVLFWHAPAIHQLPAGFLKFWAVFGEFSLGTWCLGGLLFQSRSAFNRGTTDDPKLDFDIVFNLTPLAIAAKALLQLVKLPFHWLASKWWERIHPFATQRQRIRQELSDHLDLVDSERREALRAEAQRLLRQTDELAVQLLERSAAEEQLRVTAQHDQVLTDALGEVAGELTEVQERLREVDESAIELETELAGE